jgi:hypothetical protein
MRPLYAAAVLVQTPRGLEAEMRYMHIPENEGVRYAENAFRKSHQWEIMYGKMKIVAVSQVIGFHALDDNADRCVA